MTLLHWLSYLGGVAAFLFVTLSLASGLLWLAELIEEHSKTAKTVGLRTVYAIMGLHVLLLVFDGLPLSLIAFSLAAHGVYLTNFTAQWPFISLTSPRFLLSCVMVVTDHFLWFFYFAEKAQEAKAKRQPRYRYGAKTSAIDAPSFMDVAAFFAICVWLVPLFLFLSLSANDNVLPSQDTIPGTPASMPTHFDLGTPTEGFPSSAAKSRSFGYTVPRTSLVKSILAPLLSLLPRIGGGRKRNDEGIIAPRTPLRGSPLPSPGIVPQGYSPWSGTDAPSNGNLTPGGSGSLGVNLSPSMGFQNSISNRNMLSPLMMKAPPPRRTASEIHVSGSTGSQVTPRRANSPSINGSSPGSGGYNDPVFPATEEMGSRSVSPVPMMNGSKPSAAGLTARRGGRKDD